MRKVIRQLANDGADHIKILSSGAVLTHGSNPNSQEFTPEELHAAVDEASHFGLRVEAHAHSPEGIKNAIRAGVASVEHATMIDDEGIALAKQHGTYLDMDIYDEECIQEAGKNGSMPKDFLEHDAELGQIQRDNFRKAVAAGVKMSFGTDAGICAYGTSGKQFAFMVKYGMTPMQAIQAATSNAAELLRPFQRDRIDQAGKVCGHHRRNGRSAHRYSPLGKCPVRHERRQDLQTIEDLASRESCSTHGSGSTTFGGRGETRLCS